MEILRIVTDKKVSDLKDSEHTHIFANVGEHLKNSGFKQIGELFKQNDVKNYVIKGQALLNERSSTIFAGDRQLRF